MMERPGGSDIALVYRGPPQSITGFPWRYSSGGVQVAVLKGELFACHRGRERRAMGTSTAPGRSRIRPRRQWYFTGGIQSYLVASRCIENANVRRFLHPQRNCNPFWLPRHQFIRSYQADRSPITRSSMSESDREEITSHGGAGGMASTNPPSSLRAWSTLGRGGGVGVAARRAGVLCNTTVFCV